jgi:hypothetical protein
MDKKSQAMLLSSEERAALEAAIRDICNFQATPAAGAETAVAPHFWGVSQTLMVLVCLGGLALMAPFAGALLW